MKKAVNPLDRYREEDLKSGLKVAFVGNLILGLILLFPAPNAWATNYNALLCIITSGFFFLFALFYDWKSNVLNIFLVLIYLTLLFYEYSAIGFPGMAIYIDTANYQIRKGVFMDMILYILPGIYIGIRICLAIPLLMMIRWKK